MRVKNSLVIIMTSITLAFCTQPKDGSLNQRIMSLQKDSANLVASKTEITKLKAQIDSLEQVLVKERNSSKVQIAPAVTACGLGESIAKLGSIFDQYSKDKSMYSQVNSQFLKAKGEYKKIQSTLNSKITDKINLYFSSYENNVNKIPSNPSGSSQLWVAAFKAKGNTIKTELCN